ncbi:hypothetical protein ACLKA7_009066 [Drosophila subpalustris]
MPIDIAQDDEDDASSSSFSQFSCQFVCLLLASISTPFVLLLPHKMLLPPCAYCFAAKFQRHLPESKAESLT